jgi:hypothetical protein
VAVVAVALTFVPAATTAGDKYDLTLVPEPGTSSPFALGKVVKGEFVVQSNGSKVVIKPSTKAGDGGVVIQLVLKNVDCATYQGVDDPTGNNNGKPGKCGLAKKGKTTPAMPAHHHVLAASVNFMGGDLTDVAGILYQVENGVATFEASGKNKIGGAALFGSLVKLVFNTPMGFGLFELHDAYRVCTTRWACLSAADCDSGQSCIGGACVTLGAACSPDTACPPEQTCYEGHCIAGVLCTSSTDCTAPETCVNGVCAGQTEGGSEVRCNQHTDCALATPTCAAAGQVIACSSAPLDSSSPCFAGTVYAKTGITVGCDPNLASCL